MSVDKYKAARASAIRKLIDNGLTTQANVGELEKGAAQIQSSIDECTSAYLTIAGETVTVITNGPFGRMISEHSVPRKKAKRVAVRD